MEIDTQKNLTRQVTDKHVDKNVDKSSQLKSFVSKFKLDTPIKKIDLSKKMRAYGFTQEDRLIINKFGENRQFYKTKNLYIKIIDDDDEISFPKLKGNICMRQYNFITACKNGDLDKAKEFYSNGIDVKLCHPHALLISLKNNHMDVVQWLKTLQ